MIKPIFCSLYLYTAISVPINAFFAYHINSESYVFHGKSSDFSAIRMGGNDPNKMGDMTQSYDPFCVTSQIHPHPALPLEGGGFGWG